MKFFRETFSRTFSMAYTAVEAPGEALIVKQ
jgi:hypothetical protein